MPHKQVTDKTIKDTGERMVPAYHKSHEVYGEHIVRYTAAKDVVRGKTVLDIASGSGYGTAVLAESAKKVYGVDLNAPAIAYAKKNYGSANTEFIEGSATAIPLKDNSVDVVVSFETIEHIEAYTAFMDEIMRVLKPDGLLILSTPNDVEFPEDNHYHVHEFKEKELQKLVNKYFKNSQHYYQATWLYNALLEPSQLSSEWDESLRTLQTAPLNSGKCIYFYMLCSNRKITEKVTSLGAISEHYSARGLQEYEKSIRKHIEDQAKIIQHLDNENKHKKHQIETLTKELRSTKSHLERIRNSLPGKVYRRSKRIIKRS